MNRKFVSAHLWKVKKEETGLTKMKMKPRENDGQLYFYFLVSGLKR